MDSRRKRAGELKRALTDHHCLRAALAQLGCWPAGPRAAVAWECSVQHTLHTTTQTPRGLVRPQMRFGRCSPKRASRSRSARQRGQWPSPGGPISRWLHPSSTDTSWLDATGRFDMDSSADAGKSQRKRRLINDDETSAEHIGDRRFKVSASAGAEKVFERSLYVNASSS